MKRFNGNEDINAAFKKEIEEYFDFKWKKDKNIAFQSDHDRKILDELPANVINRIFMNFLFTRFFKVFLRNFSVPNKKMKKNGAFYNS